MSGNETDKPRRRIRAAIAGAFTAILLTGIAAATTGSKAMPQRDGGDPNEFIYFWCVAGAVLAIPGAGMGIAGAVRRLTFRATAVGSLILAIYAWGAPLIPASNSEEVAQRQTIHEQVWAIAAVVAFLSVTSYAGALAGGELLDDGTTSMQFALGELLLAFVPFGVLMGYLQHIAQKWPIHHSTNML